MEKRNLEREWRKINLERREKEIEKEEKVAMAEGKRREGLPFICWGFRLLLVGIVSGCASVGGGCCRSTWRFTPEKAANFS